MGGLAFLILLYLTVRQNLSVFCFPKIVSYTNENGETITWSLQQVVDVNSVLDNDFDSSEDIVDLYARHFRNYEAYHSFEPLLSQEQFGE
jgi:hypothetical protein